MPSPTQVVLLQELERFNALITRMRSSLKLLQRALVGEVGMSAQLEELGDALFNGALPRMWSKLAPATLKNLAGWIAHFERRYAQYKSWVEQGEPAVIWLSGLHIPESYLTALVQVRASHRTGARARAPVRCDARTCTNAVRYDSGM